MNILRKASVGLLASVLSATLFLFGLSFGVLQVFGSADPIKNALADSGIYQSVVSSALDQAQKDQPTGQENQIPLDRPEVQNIIKTAASPELLQSKTENALDSVYAWVHGDTPNLEFNIETADIKGNLATGIEQYIVQHIASLPVCAPGSSGGVEDDPFNATCRPEGLDPNQAAAEAKNEFLSSEFLSDGRVSANDLKTGDGRTLAQQIEGVPSIYQAVAWGVYGSGILAVLLAIGVVLLSSTWRSGVKKVSITFIVVGAIIAATSWLAGLGMDKAAEAAKEPLQQNGVKVADALVGTLSTWWLWYGVGLVVVGAAGLVALRFVKPKTASEDTPHQAEPTGEAVPEHAAHSSTDAKPSDEAKQARPAKKLVQ